MADAALGSRRGRPRPEGCPRQGTAAVVFRRRAELEEHRAVLREEISFAIVNLRRR